MGTPDKPLQVVLQAAAFSTVSLVTGTPCLLLNVIFDNSPYLTQNKHSNSAETSIDVHDLTRLVVGNGCYNRVTDIDFSSCALLKKIRVGKFSLCMLPRMELRGLPELESVEIGEESLCCMQDDVMYLNRDLTSFDMEKSVVAHNALCIEDCPKLRTFSTGLHACWKYSSLVIRGGGWKRG